MKACVSKVIDGCATDTDDRNEQVRAYAFGAIANARKVTIESFATASDERMELLARVRQEERFMKRAARCRFETGELRQVGDRQSLQQASISASTLAREVDSIRAHPIDAQNERHDEPERSDASVWERVRPALQPSSPAFTYAVRFAVVAAVGLGFSALLRIPHGTWVTVTSWRVL